LFDPCSQYRYVPAVSLEELEEVMAGDTPMIRIVPMSESVDAEFEALMQVLDGGRWAWGDYTLVVDEASLLQKPQSLHPALARLIRQAPDDVTVIETIHRPSETHGTVRALATDYFFFQCYLARDLETIEQTWGAEVAEAVSRLPEYHVLHFWLDAGGIPRWKVWDDPKLWYIPIGRGRNE
jgi:hypothetical protein